MLTEESIYLESLRPVRMQGLIQDSSIMMPVARIIVGWGLD